MGTCSMCRSPWMNTGLQGRSTDRSLVRLLSTRAAAARRGDVESLLRPPPMQRAERRTSDPIRRAGLLALSQVQGPGVFATAPTVWVPVRASSPRLPGGIGRARRRSSGPRRRPGRCSQGRRRRPSQQHLVRPQRCELEEFRPPVLAMSPRTRLAADRAVWGSVQMGCSVRPSRLA